MKIDHVQEKDFEKSLKLDEFAFQADIPADIIDKVNEQLKWESIIGIYDGDVLAAKLSILPLAIHINEKTHLMGGIGSVATWPEYRRRGLVKQLMKKALYEMWEKGQNISFLHPFSYSFYRKFGWEWAFNEKKYTIPMARFRKKWDGHGYVTSYQHDEDVLRTIYTTYARGFNGMLTREDFIWKNWVIKKNQHIVVAYRDAGKPEGYLIYDVKNDTLNVKEFAYTSLNGWKLMLEFIGNHDSMAKEVNMSVPENDALGMLLDEQQMKQTTEAHMMARIVNVNAFLCEYAFDTAKNSSFTLHVKDAFLPENTGSYEIKTIAGESIVTALKDNVHVSSKIGIHCGVGELTMMLMGFARPSTLWEYGRINGNVGDVERLEAVLPLRQTFLADAF